MKLIKGEDNLLELFTAKEAMIKPTYIEESDNAKEIIYRLKKEDINVCIVVNKNHEFVGQINDNDIINLFLKQIKDEPLTKLNLGYSKNINYKKAKELVNKNKLKVKESTPINEVIKYGNAQSIANTLNAIKDTKALETFLHNVDTNFLLS